MEAVGKEAGGVGKGGSDFEWAVVGLYPARGMRKDLKRAKNKSNQRWYCT